MSRGSVLPVPTPQNVGLYLDGWELGGQLLAILAPRPESILRVFRDAWRRAQEHQCRHALGLADRLCYHVTGR